MIKPTTKRQAKGAHINFATVIHKPKADAPVVGALQAYDAARYISVSIPTLRRLVRRGFLRPNRVTRHLIFPVSELERFLKDGMVEASVR